MSFETLTRLRHLARPGDYMLSIDLHDGFYAVGIAPEDRDYFTVNYRGRLCDRLAGLPMGWSLSPYYFCSLTAAFNRHLRRPDFAVTSQGVLRAKLSMGDVKRCATTSALPHMGVANVLANLICRSPLLMTEMRKLWFILDSNDLSIRARCIKTTSNIWDDRLSR
eukprot:jgi/Tetstr1/465231/TSEL_009935.t2